MPARWLVVLVALALPAAAPAQTSPEPTPQELFTRFVVDDARTSATVRSLLSTGAAFVAPQPAFADLTGDGRMDAVVQVRMPGAAGTIAVYALSTHGTAEGPLRVLFRSQALYRASVRLVPGTLTIVVPAYRTGDDVCCPARRTERIYGWDPRARALRRR
jgi:hypothetical protein